MPCEVLLFNSSVFHWNYALCFQGSLSISFNIHSHVWLFCVFFCKKDQFQKVIKPIRNIKYGFGTASNIFLQFLTSCHFSLPPPFFYSAICICPHIILFWSTSNINKVLLNVWVLLNILILFFWVTSTSSNDLSDSFKCSFWLLQQS